MGEVLNNLWVICGSTVHSPNSSRIVDSRYFNMPTSAIPGARFYPNLQLNSKKVSEYKHIFVE
jgi:hypothetical protein